MNYNGNLLKLNNLVLDDYIISYKISRNKLWADDTGRNMQGSMKGSLVGNFPKIMLEIVPLDADIMSQLEQILDEASINVEYYNDKYKCTCSSKFYAGDYEEDILRRNDMMYKTFTVNLIANESEDKHVRNR